LCEESLKSIFLLKKIKNQNLFDNHIDYLMIFWFYKL